MLPLTQSKIPVVVCRRASMNSSIGWGTRLKEAWREISAVLHIRTFQIIILQAWLSSYIRIHNCVWIFNAQDYLICTCAPRVVHLIVLEIICSWEHNL